MNADRQDRQAPATLTLSGQLKHVPYCLGTYSLAAGRAAHGRPVWKHTSKDLWIAKKSTGSWVVQTEVEVGINDAAYLHLPDRGALFPSASSEVWKEGDGKVFHKAPGLQCVAGPPKEAACGTRRWPETQVTARCGRRWFCVPCSRSWRSGSRPEQAAQGPAVGASGSAVQLHAAVQQLPRHAWSRG